MPRLRWGPTAACRVVGSGHRGSPSGHATPGDCRGVAAPGVNAMTALDLAECLGAWRKVGARYLVHCPGHDDGHPSLELADGHTGIIMICRAGCAQNRVVDLVCAQAGIRRVDLFNEQRTQEPRCIVATYDYCDAQGMLLFQAVR